MKKILSVLFIVLTSLIKAQNLVPNGSFENYTFCPNSFAQIYKADGWFQPHKYPGSNSVNNSSSSDYFNACSGSTMVSVPLNAGGFQFANTGNGYIGIGYYTPNSNGNAFREYAEVKLSQVLTENKKYNLKYFICLANESWFSITKFDAHFSNDSLLYTSQNLYKIPVTPQIQHNGRINDTLNWVEVSGSFVALGGEKFLTLGNFQDGSVCDSLTASNNPTIGGAYYYIDDVSLEEDTLTGIKEGFESKISVFPNPANEKIAITNLGAKRMNEEFILYDKYGLVKRKIKLLDSLSYVRIEDLDNGIYYWMFDGARGKIVVVK